MDLEYAIKLLHPDTTGEAIAEIEYYHGFSGKKAAICAIEDALELACEAMGKRVPKKPVIDPVDCAEVCPNCKSTGIREDYGAPNKYCADCGQAIDWGE